MLTVLGAAGLAALAVGRVGTRLAPAARLVGPAVDGLRAAHSGHVGDHVAWLTLGTAALGGLFTLVTLD